MFLHRKRVTLQFHSIQNSTQHLWGIMKLFRCLRPSFLFHHYSRLLEEVPIPTKIASTVVIMGSADVLQQFMEFRQQSQHILFWKEHFSVPRLAVCFDS